MLFSSRFFTGVSFVLIILTLGVAQAQKKEIKIGFSIEAVKGERWQTDVDEFQQRAHELGGTVVTRSANGDDRTTISVLLDIFYVPNFGSFDKTGVFQQPQAFTLTTCECR